MMKRSISIVASGVVLFAAWACGAEEERTVATWAELQVVRGDGPPEPVHLEARWPEAYAARTDFERVWQVVAAGGAPVEAVAVTLTGGGEADAAGVALLVGMVLVVPTPIRPGESWSVTGTRVPPGEALMPIDWSVWGGRSPERAGEAEIALRMFDYHTLDMAQENQFVATGVTGTLSVLARHDEVVELELDLDVADGSGGVASLSGTLRIWGERYTPPVCRDRVEDRGFGGSRRGAASALPLASTPSVATDHASRVRYNTSSPGRSSRSKWTGPASSPLKTTRGSAVPVLLSSVTRASADISRSTR